MMLQPIDVSSGRARAAQTRAAGISGAAKGVITGVTEGFKAKKTYDTAEKKRDDLMAVVEANFGDSTNPLYDATLTNTLKKVLTNAPQEDLEAITNSVMDYASTAAVATYAIGSDSKIKHVYPPESSWSNTKAMAKYIDGVMAPEIKKRSLESKNGLWARVAKAYLDSNPPEPTSEGFVNFINPENINDPKLKKDMTLIAGMSDGAEMAAMAKARFPAFASMHSAEMSETRSKDAATQRQLDNTRKKEAAQAKALAEADKVINSSEATLAKLSADKYSLTDESKNMGRDDAVIVARKQEIQDMEEKVREEIRVSNLKKEVLLAISAAKKDYDPATIENIVLEISKDKSDGEKLKSPEARAIYQVMKSQQEPNPLGKRGTVPAASVQQPAKKFTLIKE